MRLNLLSEEKSVSAGSLFRVLITRSPKKVVRIFRLFDFLNNLYRVKIGPVDAETIGLTEITAEILFKNNSKSYALLAR